MQNRQSDTPGEGLDPKAVAWRCRRIGDQDWQLTDYINPLTDLDTWEVEPLGVIGSDTAGLPSDQPNASRKEPEPMSVILTVADHEQNGFVALARWPNLSEAEAREFIEANDAAVDDDAEPDIATASFTFILDLMDDANGDLIDTGKRQLPTQLAMSLAPDQVRQWLEERPDPDSVMHRTIPVAKGA